MNSFGRFNAEPKKITFIVKNKSLELIFMEGRFFIPFLRSFVPYEDFKTEIEEL